jgi:oligopeptide/dipeptide ABC transporter ATP-binding protein
MRPIVLDRGIDLTDQVILTIEHLSTSFGTDEGRIRAVEDVGFEVKAGKTLGVVGESGCGKSVTALSIMRLLPKPSGIIEKGRILLNGLDLAQLKPEQMRNIRGKRISMIFQEPMTALNPVHRIGRQLGEVFQIHFPKMSNREIAAESIALLERVGIPNPDERLNEYPHQISGGMRQRVMIAMALAGKPEILIADEPTTALDVTIQAQILDLIKSVQDETGMAVIFITHDLGVIAEICDDVVVMYAGRIVEKAGVVDLFYSPGHPYTKGLLSSIPRLDSIRKSKLSVISGMVPNLMDLPSGCRFQNRCPETMAICKAEAPELIQVGDSHYVSCFLVSENRTDRR